MGGVRKSSARASRKQPPAHPPFSTPSLSPAHVLSHLLNEIIRVKHLASCFANSEHLINVSSLSERPPPYTFTHGLSCTHLAHQHWRQLSDTGIALAHGDTSPPTHTHTHTYTHRDTLITLRRTLPTCPIFSCAERVPGRLLGRGQEAQWQGQGSGKKLAPCDLAPSWRSESGEAWRKGPEAGRRGGRRVGL